MTRVAIVIERFNLALGGAERSTYEIAQQLGKIGIDADILAATSSEQTDKIIPLCGRDNKKRISFAAYREAVKAYTTRQAYDIVHSTLPFDFAEVYHPMGGSYRETMLRNAASYPLALTRGWKKLTHLTNRRRSVYLKAEETLCANNRTVIAAQSNYVIRQFVDHYNLPLSRLFLVPNGVDIELHYTPDQTVAAWHKIASGLSIQDRRDTTVLLFGANNFRLKGLREILLAMAQCRKTNPGRRIVLVVAGSGKQRHYQSLAQSVGIEKDVFFYGYTDNIQPLMAVCDVAVLASFYDPCSRYILEGLAMEKPVITTRYNGSSEYYEHLRHGVILDRPDDIRQFAEGLARVTSPQIREAMSTAIKNDNLIATVSIENHCRAIAQMYRSVLNSQHKG